MVAKVTPETDHNQSRGLSSIQSLYARGVRVVCDQVCLTLKEFCRSLALCQISTRKSERFYLFAREIHVVARWRMA